MKRLALVSPLALLAFLGFLRFGGPVRAQEAHTHQAPPQTRLRVFEGTLTSEDRAAGAALYAENCARCHGADGRGRTREAARLPKAPADLARPEAREHTEGEIFWVIENGIKASGMPAFGDIKETDRWKIVAHVRSLAAPSNGVASDRTVNLRFRATVGAQPFSCTSTYADLGASKALASPLDFRFYIHDVRLVRRDGSVVPVRLDNDGQFQDGETALLDFEDGSGTCANGTPARHEVVTGRVPQGNYVGVRFTVGVPFAKNHKDPITQAPPLDLTQLFWVWNAGYKFARIDMKASGKNFFVHLGSTDCTPDTTAQTVPTSCAHPNRPEVNLADFDVDRDVVEADLARLVEGVDLQVNQPKTAMGCMSGPTDSDCAGIFANFGLPFGSKPAREQSFLARAPRPKPYAWNLPAGFPLPRVPPENPMNEAKVELGKRLFYDVALSVNGTTSCATCHQQALAFTDGKARSVGATGEVHPRGAMSLANVGYSPALTWANPNMTALERQALVPMFGETPVEMGLAGREEALLSRLASHPLYKRLFAEAFAEEAPAVSLVHLTRALAAFERTLISGGSPYDRYRSGVEPDALKAGARRGEALFFSERLECFHCHGGFNFTQTVDYAGRNAPEVEFHNTGLYNLDGRGAYPEPNTGVMAISGRAEDMGRFKAPTLRNIEVTAPYMHDGSVATLEDAIAHYAEGGRRIREGAHAGLGATSPLKSGFVKGFTLSAEETRDLVDFLRSLTDAAFLRDPRHADPWRPDGAANAKRP